MLVAAIVISGTTNLPQLVEVGPVSGLGALTITCGLLFVPFWFLEAHAVVRIPPWLRIFVLWVVTASILSWPVEFLGLQNVLVFALFAATIAMAWLFTLEDDGFPDRIDTGVHLAAWLAAALYGASVLLGGLGSGAVMGSRSYALFALVPFGWALSHIRFERRYRLLAVVLFMLILFSLSRGALVAATIMVALAWFDVRNVGAWVKTASVVLIASIAFSLALDLVPGLQSRFYAGDVQTVAGGLAVNTSGRESIWRPVWDDYLRSPVIGHGPGTGDALTAKLSSPEQGGTGGAGNVHNDYLRILHDYGIVGLFLWIAAAATLIHTLYKGTGVVSAPRAKMWPWAGYLSLVGISLEMVVDNPVIEVDVMVPLGILVGVGLAFAGGRVVEQPGHRSLPAPNDVPVVSSP